MISIDAGTDSFARQNKGNLNNPALVSGYTDAQIANGFNEYF
jgi:hypothetical protein